MRLLLDTHALLWWFLEDRQLSQKAAAAIADTDNEVSVSAVSGMEVATKYKIRKLPEMRMHPVELLGSIRQSRFRMLDVTFEHALRAGGLADPHKDPWDRLLAAQTDVEKFTLVTRDPFFGRLGLSVLW